MKNSKLSMLSKVLVLIASVLLFSSIFFPLWKIDLEAPQYPEGLTLRLFADKIGGDVDIINGLNHYIGMKTLHTENFFEFSIMKYIFIGFAIFGLITFLTNKKKLLYTFFISFVLFVVLAAIDFYRWNYNYGHDLNPDAAIKVPGMAYQPPLIGYKQLLNFGAYSIPDIGGFLMIGAGLLLLVAVVRELKLFKKTSINAALLVLFTISILSCSNRGPKPIFINKDICDYCTMTISNLKYSSELITAKGRVYKFDDISCMIKFAKSNTVVPYKAFYVNDFLADNKLIPVEQGHCLMGGTIHGPMNGKVAVFSTKNDAEENQSKLNAQPVDWKEIYNLY